MDDGRSVEWEAVGEGEVGVMGIGGGGGFFVRGWGFPSEGGGV